MDGISTKKSSNGNTSEKSKQEEYNDALRDLKTQWLSKMEASVASSMYEELTTQYPDHSVVHSAYLQVIDPLDKKILPGSAHTCKAEDLQRVISVCNAVIDSLNEESILAYMATKTDLRTDANKIKSVMEQQKNVYMECLSRKGIALCRLQSIEKDEKTEEISEIWRSLVKFVDPCDAKVLPNHVVYFSIWHAYVNNQYGRLIKYALKLQEDKASDEVEKRIMEYCDKLGWQHVANHLKRCFSSKFPVAYKPF